MAASTPRVPSLPAAGRRRSSTRRRLGARSTCSPTCTWRRTRPQVFAAWAAHLRYTDADAVFILGDLFEVWVGDDMAERGFEARCVEVLAAAAAERTVAFMPGNRDFLVGDAMLQASGVIRLPTRRWSSRSAIASCSRTATRSASTTSPTSASAPWSARPFVQRAFGALPLAARSAIGRTLRRTAAAGDRADEHGSYVDVDTDAALAWLRDAEAATLVHGHTHRPASHDLAPGARAPCPERLGSRRQQRAACRDPALGCERPHPHRRP